MGYMMGGMYRPWGWGWGWGGGWGYHGWGHYDYGTDIHNDVDVNNTNITNNYYGDTDGGGNIESNEMDTGQADMGGDTGMIDSGADVNYADQGWQGGAYGDQQYGGDPGVGGYDQGGYDLIIDYTEAPIPPLSDEDMLWVKSQMDII